MLAVLVALVVFLIWGASQTLTPAPTTTVMKPPPPPFTIDGRAPPVRAGAVTLREGEVIRFGPAVRVLRVNRLECPNDAHRIAIRSSTWRVPDLPTGYYGVETADRGQLVRVESHSAPCP